MNNATVKKFHGEAVTAGRRAIAFVDSKREVAAKGLDSMATTIHKQADRIGRLATKGHQTGETLEDAATYVRRHSADRLLDDIAHSVQSDPITALLLGGSVGLFVGWTLTRRFTTRT